MEASVSNIWQLTLLTLRLVALLTVMFALATCVQTVLPVSQKKTCVPPLTKPLPVTIPLKG